MEFISIIVPLIVLYAGLLFYSDKLTGKSDDVITAFVMMAILLAFILILIAVYLNAQKQLRLYLKVRKGEKPNEKHNVDSLKDIFPEYTEEALTEFLTNSEISDKKEFLKNCKSFRKQMVHGEKPMEMFVLENINT